MSSEILRRKSAMIIYSIESSIIKFLKEENISFDDRTINFGDSINLTSKIKNTAKESSLKRLRDLYEILELATIRNTCAHATRDFESHQWYKVACFSSDACIQDLAFHDVIDALACAESGKISDPPIEWLEKLKISNIPNNLPSLEKFDSTGLIGRNKEIENIKSGLTNSRINTFTLVGPGGVGKTSLAIEVARQLSSKIYNNPFDSIIFLTFKTNDLTATGKVNINSDEVTKNIKDSFNRAIQQVYQEPENYKQSFLETLEAERILVLLDNFEDLILEKNDECSDFINELPSNWKVLISSRVSFDGSKNIPISGLNIGSSEMLARKYFESISGKRISDEILTNTTTTCNGNPLSLKLMLDRINLGHSIDDAKSITQSEILEFSFSSLIQSLSEKQISLLECIFVLTNAKRIDLIELTDFKTDEFVENINILNKTSLIERKFDEYTEYYNIADSLRDLLARSPLNINIRNFYSKKLNNIRIKQQKNNSLGIIDFSSFEDSTPAALINIGDRLPKLLFNYNLSTKDLDYVRNFEEKITNYESMCKNNSDYYRLRSISRVLLNDLHMAIEFGKKSVELNPNSLPSAAQYSYALISANQNIEAQNVLIPFITDLLTKLKDKIDLLQIYSEYIIRETFSSFFKTFIWENKSDDVLNFTKNWKTVPDYLKITFIVSRSSALRRSAENLNVIDPARILNLIESSKLIVYCFEEIGVIPSIISKEATKVRNDLFYKKDQIPLSTLNVFQKNANKISFYLNDGHPEFLIEERTSTSLEITVIALKRGYCFGEDKENNEFFIPFSSFHENITPNLIGQKIIAENIDDHMIKGRRKVNKALVQES